jgi:beta-xylosidase
MAAAIIRIIELTSDATAVKAGGLNQVIIPNAGSIAGSGGLAVEGSHTYKINGQYYVFLISWPSGGMRTELVYRASSIAGPYQGQVILRNSGIAQGGVVNTPDGR